MGKNYYGKCGMCKHLKLETAYTFCYSTTFKCAKDSFGSSIKADDKPCSKYEPDNSRTNEYIAKFDK